ncbi:MAG: hypothetical protein ACRD1X_05500 [Vicinamibacteria bacterium]
MTPKVSQSRQLGFLLAAGLVAAAAMTLVWAQQSRREGEQQPEIVGDVPLFETTAWRTQGELFLRSAGEDPEDLLLMHRKAKEVHRYDPNTGRLHAWVPYEDWERATGPIDVYESDFPPSPLHLREFLERLKFSPEGGWMVRSEGNDKDTLLLTHFRLEVVYRYDRVTQELSLVPNEQWESASGPVVECDSQPVSVTLRVDPLSKLPFVGERQLDISGKVALDARPSASGRWVAVLSADGPASPPSWLFSMGGGGASGQHYHQVLRAEGYSSTGPPVRLPFETERGYFRLCWSPEEDYVVYTNSSFLNLVIVRFEKN